MRQFFIGLFIVIIVAGLEFACTRSAHAQTPSNAIKMGYNFVTVSQTVVFNSAMQAGGTFTLSTQAMDGGGRAPGDPFVIKMVFYNSSNAIVNTAQLSNTLVYGATAPTTYTTTTTNCGGSCATVAYVNVEFYGKDGGYWAGNYGPYIINPSLSFNGGPNILYNPGFGVYGTNGFAQGWTSSNGWQNCALYSGAQTCVINNGAPVNGGNYSSTGGSTSGTSGGYVAPPPEPTYTSNISTAQQSRVTAFQNRSITNNNIYIDQVGDNNTVNITQTGNKSSISGIGQQAASIQGNSNSVTIRQGDVADTNKNEINLRVQGDSNTLNINQGVTTTGATVNSTNGMYQRVDVVGNTNTLTTQQTNTGGVGGHYMETTINGNTNNVTALQLDNGNKTMFTTVTGNNNTVTATQSGTGQHYLESVLMGNGNSVIATQSGATQNRASISITNAGGPGSVDLQQTGGQVYNITTTCVTAGGCSPVVVRQGN
jgi:hypothetical protein